MHLRLTTFNCRGLKGSITDLVSLSKVSDIICLQETWLMSNELGILNDCVPGLSGVWCFCIDISSGLLRGRPYGGVAILWHKSLNYNIQSVYSGLDWLLAVTVSDDNHNLYNADIRYLDCLGKIGPYMILGDFNCNHSPCGKVLNDHITDCDLTLIDCYLPSDSYTYISDAWHSSSWLDHCVAPKCVLSMLVDCKVIYDSYNSDHFPLATTIDIHACNTHFDGTECSKPQFMFLPSYVSSQGLSEIYQSHVAGYLNDINLHTFEVICCQDTNCVSSEHNAQIDLLYTHLTDCLTSATSLCFGFGHPCSNSSLKKSMPGWSDFVSDARPAASDAHNIWQQCNKPNKKAVLSQGNRAMPQFFSVEVRQQHSLQV